MSTEKPTQLLEGESVLWKGQPKRKTFSIVHPIIIMFLFVFGVMGYMAFTRIFNMFEVPAYGIETIGNKYLIGFAIFFIGFIIINQLSRNAKNKRTYYFITNLRAIIVRRYREEVFTSVKLYPDLSIELKLKAKGNGNGSILFGSSAFLEFASPAFKNSNVHVYSNKKTFSASGFSAGFYNIDDAETVLRLLRKTMDNDWGNAYDERY